MGASTKKASVKLEAMNVSWGAGFCRTWQTIGSATIGGDYIEFNSVTNLFVNEDRYIWFNLGADADPAPAGRTNGIEVALGAADDAATVAITLKAALDLENEIRVLDITGDVLTVENRYFGARSDEDMGITTFIYTLLNAGFGGTLGSTDGGITLATENSLLEVKADQFGETIIDELVTGTSASIEMSLLEMTDARWSLLVGNVMGGKVTPSAGTEVVGYGEARNYDSIADLSGMLVMHPVRVAAGVFSDDIVFWKCAPNPSSVNFSGTETQKMSVTFKAYLDATKDTAVNLWARGDWTQDGLDL